MITIRHPIEFTPAYPLEHIAPASDLIFFDIETTGFSAQISSLYLIGCIFQCPAGWEFIQWFAESPSDEAALINAFGDFLSDFKVLIHFNGNRFDIPYLLQCAARLELPLSFDHLKSFDIYKAFKPYRRLPGLESLKQKAIEKFLGIRREDRFSGGELIEVYYRYVRTRDEELLHLLLLHNEDDLRGMGKILSVLHYPDFFNGDFSFKSLNLKEPDASSEAHPQLSLSWQSGHSLPRSCRFFRPPLTLQADQNRLFADITLFNGELKFFYSNYRDYFYLPAEDTAIHKSIGAFVEKEARQKATARTCYTKKSGLFIPQFAPLWEPSLYESYKSVPAYTPYTRSLFDDEALANAYAKQLISYACPFK